MTDFREIRSREPAGSLSGDLGVIIDNPFIWRYNMQAEYRINH